MLGLKTKIKLRQVIQGLHSENLLHSDIEILHFFSPSLRFLWLSLESDGIQDALQVNQVVQDPLHVPDGPITRLRANKIKKAMNGLVQRTMTETILGQQSKSIASWKISLRDEEPAVVHYLQVIETQVQDWRHEDICGHIVFYMWA